VPAKKKILDAFCHQVHLLEAVLTNYGADKDFVRNFQFIFWQLCVWRSTVFRPPRKTQASVEKAEVTVAPVWGRLCP
jgi:hypothetical protein